MDSTQLTHAEKSSLEEKISIKFSNNKSFVCCLFNLATAIIVILLPQL